MPHVGLVTVVVRDYDEAIAFYVRVLGFRLLEDSSHDARRWVVVAPPGGKGSSLLLAGAVTSAQQDRVGDQTGGRVSFFLYTDEFEADYERLRAGGVIFTEAPRHELYGTGAVFEDLYGNRWDLIEARPRAGGSG